MTVLTALGPALVPFVATTFVLAMVPGVGQALMTRQTLVRGRRAALASVAGTGTGLVIWGSAGALGLSAVLLAQPTAYLLLRVVGGLYLVYLGVRGLLAARARDHAVEDVTAADASGERRRDFWQGLATNLGNPKAGVFAVAVLPSFVPPTAPLGPAVFVLGLLWAVVTVAWYVIFVALVGVGRSFMTRPRVQRGLAWGTSGVLLGLGLSVAVLG